MTEKLPKEQIHDDQISPLMRQIYAICAVNKIAMLTVMDLGTDPEDDERHMTCSSVWVKDECNPSSLLLLLRDILAGGSRVAQLLSESLARLAIQAATPAGDTAARTTPLVVPEGELPEANIRQAFLWTCDACGRDNYESVIVLEDPDVIEARFGPYVAVSPHEWREVVRAPSHVKCGHCDAIHRAEYPEGTAPAEPSSADDPE